MLKIVYHTQFKKDYKTWLRRKVICGSAPILSGRKTVTLKI